MMVSAETSRGGRWRYILGITAVGVLASCDGASAQPVDEGAPAETAAAKADPPSARATRVEVAVIETSEASHKVSLPGEVDAARDALLASPLGGFVEAVHVEDGQTVKKGKALVYVDTASHAARAAQAQVELQTAERELKRAKLLGDALPGAELDAAEARYKAAKAAVWTTQVAATRAVISAPFDGVVIEVDAEVGEVATPGAPLVRVVQLDPAVVTVSLTDRDVVAVKEGLKARVTTDARSGVHEGVVKRVQPAADLKTRSFTAEIELDNAEGKLLPGMIVRADLDIEGDGSQLFISQDWLVTGLDKMGLFVVDAEGKARFRDVKLGPIVRRQVVVEEGLSKGDLLIVTGHRELADGDAVLISRKGVCCDNGRVRFD